MPLPPACPGDFGRANRNALASQRLIGHAFGLAGQPGQADRALFQPPDNAAKRKAKQQRHGQGDPGQ